MGVAACGAGVAELPNKLFTCSAGGSGPQAVAVVLKKRSVVSNTMFDNSHLQAARYPSFQPLIIGYKPVRTTRDNRIAC